MTENHNRRYRLPVFCAVLGVLVTQASASAAETITYTYDAKGRLTKVVRTGAVNNGVVTDYTHDKADNRSTVKISGSASAAK